jgi:hypothetical protein
MATNMTKVNTMAETTNTVLAVSRDNTWRESTAFVIIGSAQLKADIEKINTAVPTRMKGLRRPHDDWQRSLQLPKYGWKTAPQMGPESNAMAIPD